MSPASNIERETDRLYGLPLEEFTQARDALAKKLRKEGDREMATEVAKLKKPSLGAWALNQLQRTHKPDVKRLLAAGDKTRSVQGRALAGGQAKGLPEALAEQQEAIRVLVGEAREVLGARATEAALDRVAGALRVASIDASARELFVAGRLVSEPEPSGFDVFAGMPVAKRKSSGRKGAKSEARNAARRREARQKASALKQELEEHERTAKEAMRTARTAEQRAEKLRGQIEALEREA